MEALAWWLIPIVATLLAILWVTWISRPRRPADPHDTLAEHRRFTSALQPAEPFRAADSKSNDEAEQPHSEHTNDKGRPTT